MAKRERPFACPSSAKERGVGALLPIEFHTYAEQLTVANYIKLTNRVHNKTGADKPGAVYVKSIRFAGLELLSGQLMLTRP